MVKNVGFVGLGNMGTPMVRRLVDAGYQVAAWDTAPAARARLADVPGVRVAGDVAAGADAVILMLPDSDVVEAVVLDGGLLDRLDPHTVLVDMSSSEPMRTRALAARCAERGVTLVDAPVSGGVVGAVGGTLTVMVGGPAGTVERLRPVLEVFGSRVIQAGEAPGSGHAIKALNNLMSAAHLMVSAEAMHAARAFGLDPLVALDIVNGSSGRSASTENKWPKFILPGGYDSGFSLRLMVKDMGVAVALEHATGVPSTLSEAALAAWSAAAAALPADADHTEVARWVEELRTPTA